MSRLQFGQADAGVTYRDRPAAFGVLERDGRIALVRVTLPDRPPFFDLPGGAVEGREDELQALVREFGEETGLKVRPIALLVRASQYLRKKDGQAVNNRAGHYLAELLGEDPGLKVEDDHELVWRTPVEALASLRHDSHAWAVACWMRRR